MIPQPPEGKRLSDQVAHQIRLYIQEHRLMPGDRLPTELVLAERLGVSRAAVREATKGLESLGLVETAPRRGLRVGRLDFSRVAPWLQFHPSIRDSAPIQLIETRIIIETGALPFVMQRMADDSSIYVRLHEINQLVRHATTLDEWIPRDIAFHHQLLESCGLKPLMAFGELLEAFFTRFRESVQQAEWKDGADSHQRLIDLLREGDLASACVVIRQHIESHKERLSFLTAADAAPSRLSDGGRMLPHSSPAAAARLLSHSATESEIETSTAPSPGA